MNQSLIGMTPAEIEHANSLLKFGQLELPLGHVPQCNGPDDHREIEELIDCHEHDQLEAPRLASLLEEQS